MFFAAAPPDAVEAGSIAAQSNKGCSEKSSFAANRRAEPAKDCVNRPSTYYRPAIDREINSLYSHAEQGYRRLYRMEAPYRFRRWRGYTKCRRGRPQYRS